MAGIGHYGNSIGVATVGGEIYFEPAYEQNCLVNAMCLGLIETERLIRSAAAGVGNVVLLFGARTGRDGIGGASVLASAELGAEDAAKRPTVQIGDPFEEKKLLECSLELLDRGLLVALQDLGAAGLTSSSSEMAAKGGVGHRPRRDDGAAPRGRHGAVRDHDLGVPGAHAVRGRARARSPTCVAVCERWEVNATAIGVVTDTGRLRVLAGDEVVGDLPVAALVDECPAYDLEPAAPGVPLYPAPGARARRGRRSGGRPARPARLAEPRLAPLGVRAVRLPRRLAHGAAARAGRRRRAGPRRARSRGARSPSPSTATAAAWPATRIAARWRRWSNARPTSPARAPSRSA